MGHYFPLYLSVGDNINKLHYNAAHNAIPISPFKGKKIYRDEDNERETKGQKEIVEKESCW